MSWYNCWLAHTWEAWEYTQVKVRDTIWSDFRLAEGQQRKCTVCNLVQIRKIG